LIHPPTTVHSNTVLGPPFTALPEYLKSHAYKNPTSGLDSPWQAGYATDQHPFVWLASHPERFRLFMTWMPLERHGLSEFIDVYPFEEECGRWTTDGTMLFVDIGSALGSQSVPVRNRFPGLKGRVIMQDQQHFVDAWGATADTGIEAMVYDLFYAAAGEGYVLLVLLTQSALLITALNRRESVLHEEHHS
jgi:hypothetical protein